MRLSSSGVIYAISALLFAGCQTVEPAAPKNPAVIRTDAFDADFTDLEPLVELIGESRVVVLGEQTHSNGAATAVKARLVRFLHERMGFDVLAWEAGMLDAERTNQYLSGDEPILQASRHLMLGDWTAGANSKPMWEYARETWNTGRPLMMSGFDGFRAPFDLENLNAVINDMTARCPGLKVSDGDRSKIDEMLELVTGLIQTPKVQAWKATTEDGRAVRRAAMQEFIERAFGENGVCVGMLDPREAALYERVLKRTLDEEIMRGLWLVSGESARRSKLRDQLMGADVNFLANERFPDKKIIIWAATAHFAFNVQEIQVADDPDYYNDIVLAGDHVRPVLGDDLYVIGVTAYGGEEGQDYNSDWGERAGRDAEPIKTPPADFFETWAHDQGEDLLFVDLRSLPKDHPFGDRFKARPLGYVESEAVWRNHLDALLFIDMARPVQPLVRQPTN